jgi:cysteinyl-tRNA synthetase
MNKLKVYNTLTAKKEIFTPINKDIVTMYVCGPTVYGEPHLGHARPAITFDILFRYLMFSGHKVRYVRNITDVGHLLNDADEGEDKIVKKAKSLHLEPMEVAHFYTKKYHESMISLNVKSPSIEPTATGHIIEQINMVQKIIDNGYAYESNGSVYFDVITYNKDYDYGMLSKRKVEDLIGNNRDLDGQSDKKNSVDFALWKKASTEHIMRWDSPWGQGFPGWHIECSTMSCKYLGHKFDIHGGGMDLVFPHHEAEIAQCYAANQTQSATYWMHNNMITIAGQKMGKSLGNFITLSEFFSGSHEKLDKAYSPMVIRFFLLQAHYRSTIDFSNNALQASEKGLIKMFNAFHTIDKLPSSLDSDIDVSILSDKCYDALNDDFNTPIVLAHLFEAVKFINSAYEGRLHITEKDTGLLKILFTDFLIHIFGLKELNISNESNDSELNNMLQLLIDTRQHAKENQNWDISDMIRTQLEELGFIIKDTKDGATWERKK